MSLERKNGFLLTTEVLYFVNKNPLGQKESNLNYMQYFRYTHQLNIYLIKIGSLVYECVFIDF